MSFRGAAIVLLLSMAAVPAAHAHPHVFVDAWVGLRFADQGFEAVNLSWRFDEDRSAVLLQKFDRDGSGGFTLAAVREMERQHLREFQSVEFFLGIQVNGAAVPVADMRGFGARVEREQVIYLFTLGVRPLASSEGVVRINVADPGDYIAFALVEPVHVEAAGPYQVECRLARDPETRRPEGVKCTYRRRDSP